MATIKTDYDLGTVFYFLVARDTTVRTPCTDCDGTGRVKALLSGDRTCEVGCPSCGGKKNISGKARKVYDVKRGTVCQIGVTLCSKHMQGGRDVAAGTSVVYYLIYEDGKCTQVSKPGTLQPKETDVGFGSNVWYDNRQDAIKAAAWITNEADRKAGFTDAQTPEIAP